MGMLTTAESALSAGNFPVVNPCCIALIAVPLLLPIHEENISSQPW